MPLKVKLPRLWAFKRRYGYAPGAAYNGGIIGQTASGVDGDHIVIRTADSTHTYHTRWYRQHIS